MVKKIVIGTKPSASYLTNIGSTRTTVLPKMVLCTIVKTKKKVEETFVIIRCCYNLLCFVNLYACLFVV